MCYRCAASNQSPKTSPEDTSSSPPLPSSSSKELPGEKNEEMVNCEIISIIKISNSQINDPAVIQVPAISSIENITEIKEEQEQENKLQSYQQLEHTFTAFPVPVPAVPVPVPTDDREPSLTVSEEDEEQDEPPPLVEEEDDERLNNNKFIFNDGMDQIHANKPRLPVCNFTPSSGDLNFNDDAKNLNGKYMSFFMQLIFENKYFIRFLINLAGLASASTISIPHSPSFLPSDPDDERGEGASSSSATAFDDDGCKTDGDAAAVQAISNQEVPNTGGAVSVPTFIAAVEKNSAERNIQSAIVGVKRRKKQEMPVHAPLEEKRCRGACGNSSRCLSSTRDFQDQLIHCTNYYERIKCPLWLGPNCAEAFHSFKCRICTLIDSNRSARYHIILSFLTLFLYLIH